MMAKRSKEKSNSEQNLVAKNIPTSIEQEMKGSYIDYAMSVIVGRALPDVRDGLKPVHRRILFAMDELGLQPNRPYKKGQKGLPVYRALLTYQGATTARAIRP